ncbi:hypothetical protein ONE63_003702 [Megalurothrips usitatus]|uniref:Homeotic protein antennapedia-like n=1 Tax=Megalurothrips usitatus TaxID=439358 RepID=A0AAV7XAT2_9NEOP|nr:hypothetical protein ONE63_003702 [Megalurothrips usitatus]
MSSYFANAYMPPHGDMRNGGEHPHQHQHYGAAVAGPPIDPSGVCGVNGDMRQGVVPPHGAPHHYQGHQGMPYPRFPPYDRMDIRNAAYYNAQQGMMDDQGYRPTSPIQHMTHPHGPPNGHPNAPVVYASCKLQAAAVGPGGVIGGPVSPPLDNGMNSHPNHHQQQAQHHHMVNHQQAPPPPQQQQQQPPPQLQQPPPQQHHPQQQTPPHHMMYNNVNPAVNGGGMPPHPHHQQVMSPHQAPPQGPPPSAQQQQQQNNNNSSLPSPLYPWMRSQFGECDHWTALRVRGGRGSHRARSNGAQLAPPPGARKVTHPIPAGLLVTPPNAESTRYDIRVVGSDWATLPARRAHSVS